MSRSWDLLSGDVQQRLLDLAGRAESYAFTSYERVAAVYFLFRRGVVVYVGMTGNLHQRIMEHRCKAEGRRRRRGFTFQDVLFIRCDHAELAELEGLFLATLCPVENSPAICQRWLKKLSLFTP